MVRLLAYGGTSFTERRWIGHWPTIAPGVLGDLYGVAGARAAFGCGWSHGAPFLIWRTLRNPHLRGGYPYTLLLDPGTEVWRTFGFNAAWLLHSILADNECVSLLVDGVDQVTPQDLESVLTALRPARLPAGSPFDATPLWPAVTLAGPVVVGGPPPDLAECARGLAALPVCFRIAGGWLVSGCALHGEAFGTPLVFDEKLEANGRRYASLGESILRLWRTAAHDDRFAHAVRALSEIPAERWARALPAVVDAIGHGRAETLRAMATMTAHHGESVRAPGPVGCAALSREQFPSGR